MPPVSWSARAAAPPRTVRAIAAATVSAAFLTKRTTASLRRGCRVKVYTRATFCSGYAAPPTHSSRLLTVKSMPRTACGGTAGGGGMSGYPFGALFSIVSPWDLRDGRAGPGY